MNLSLAEYSDKLAHVVGSPLVYGSVIERSDRLVQFCCDSMTVSIRLHPDPNDPDHAYLVPKIIIGRSSSILLEPIAALASLEESRHCILQAQTVLMLLGSVRVFTRDVPCDFCALARAKKGKDLNCPGCSGTGVRILSADNA